MELSEQGGCMWKGAMKLSVRGWKAPRGLCIAHSTLQLCRAMAEQAWARPFPDSFCLRKC